MNLFAYGSLMFDEIWSKVVSGRYEKRQARLTGYSRREVAGETYPALVPGSPGDGVDGTVYFDLHPKDMERLDRFEGNQYCRKREVCQLSDGSHITVWVFLFRHEFGTRVTGTEWRPEDFARGEWPFSSPASGDFDKASYDRTDRFLDGTGVIPGSRHHGRGR